MKGFKKMAGLVLAMCFVCVFAVMTAFMIGYKLPGVNYIISSNEAIHTSNIKEAPGKQFNYLNNLKKDSDNTEVASQDNDICGTAFDILGRSFEDIENAYGELTDPICYSGSEFFSTPDEKRVGFDNSSNSEDVQEDSICMAYMGDVTEVFNVKNDISLAELAAALGVDYEEVSYVEGDNDMLNAVIWYISYNDEAYKVIVDYDRDLMVERVNITFDREGEGTEEQTDTDLWDDTDEPVDDTDNWTDYDEDTSESSIYDENIYTEEDEDWSDEDWSDEDWSDEDWLEIYGLGEEWIDEDWDSSESEYSDEMMSEYDYVYNSFDRYVGWGY